MPKRHLDQLIVVEGGDKFPHSSSPFISPYFSALYSGTKGFRSPHAGTRWRPKTASGPSEGARRGQHKIETGDRAPLRKASGSKPASGRQGRPSDAGAPVLSFRSSVRALRLASTRSPPPPPLRKDSIAPRAVPRPSTARVPYSQGNTNFSYDLP